MGGEIKSSTIWAIQPNGERISIETWAYEAYLNGTLRDEVLFRFLENAVSINLNPGWPRPERKP